MEAVFLRVLNMGIAAGWVILGVLLLRLVLRKAPKAFRCALWLLVAIRLVCPFSLKSVLSLIPSAETVPQTILLDRAPAIDSGIDALDQVVNPVITDSFTPNPEASANPMQIVVFLAAALWLAGMALMLLYALGSCIRLRRKVTASLRMEENIWICDEVKSPFIFGIVSPRIYLPSDLEGQALACVIAHEKAHLKHHDHWWKPLGFVLLTVYWFQPLCWIAYILLCRDIELACDERVVKGMEKDEKKQYAEALLSYSAPRHMISACPLAFGETGLKERVKGVLLYHKPAFRTVIAAAAVCAMAAVCFLTNPLSAANDWEIFGARYSVKEALYDLPWMDAVYSAEYAAEYIFTTDGALLQKSSGGVFGSNDTWNMVGVFREDNEIIDRLPRLFQWGWEFWSDSGDTEQIFDSPEYIPGLAEEDKKTLEKVERVWRVDVDKMQGSYFIMETRDRQILMAVVYRARGEEYIRWLWKMKKHSALADTEYLEGLIESMGGKKGRIFAIYESDRMPGRLIAGYDDGNKRGYAVFKQDSGGSGWRITGYTSGESDSLSHVTLGEDWGFDHSVTIVLSGRGDLAYVTARAGEEFQKEITATSSAPAMCVFEWEGILEEDAVEVHYYGEGDRELK